jgi:hypothetical protein
MIGTGVGGIQTVNPSLNDRIKKPGLTVENSTNGADQEMTHCGLIKNQGKASVALPS